MIPFCLLDADRVSIFVYLIFHAVHWIVATESRCHSILHFVDDFFIVSEPNCDECEAAVQVMVKLCKKLGVPLAAENAEGPATTMLFLGLQINSKNQTLSLALRKVTEMYRALYLAAFMVSADNLFPHRTLEPYRKAPVCLQVRPSCRTVYATYDSSFIRNLSK